MIELPFATLPAQIVFHASEKNPKTMTGRLLNPHACWDRTTGRPVTWTPWVRLETLLNGKVAVTFQGGDHPGGRRHVTAINMLAAQKKAIRWASRRFRVAADGSRP